ncbi:hypothetical protein [Piscirickettsia salmonis]
MDKQRDVVVENVIKVLACSTTVMGHSKYGTVAKNYSELQKGYFLVLSA